MPEREGKNEERRDSVNNGSRQSPFRKRDIWRLIMRSYITSLPYLLIFILGLLLTAWVLTQLIFR